MVWAMLVGITMQFFINMEVERYALVYGESVFVGFTRIARWFPVWFIVTTFLGFGWPGIGLAGATLIGAVIGGPDAAHIAIAAFIVIGLILSVGSVLYQTVEQLQKIMIGIGVPFIALLTLSLAKPEHWRALAAGFVGQGEGFTFLPEGIVLGTFLGALAYAGAGGNLNLAQSCYVRDKGYGMGAYADRIGGMLRGKQAKKFRITGQTFPLTSGNLRRFADWWRVMNREHLMIFWFLGLMTMSLLALLAYVTAYHMPGNAEGITFVMNEARMIAQQTFPIFGTAFLLVTGCMLLATQLTVLDSTSRIMTENVLLLRRGTTFAVTRTYYVILWLQIAFAVGVFSLGFVQPKELIILGAIINAFTMFVYTGLLLIFCHRLFPKPLRPSLPRTIALALTFCFFGVFSVLTIMQQF